MDVIITFASILANALQGVVILQFCGSKKVSSIMLPKPKKRLKSLGVGIIILNKNSFRKSHYGCINCRVYFRKDLQQYLIYKDFHQLYLLLVEALELLKTMGILDLMITLSQMLEWTKTFAGIKDYIHMPAERMNAYDAKYKKLVIGHGVGRILIPAKWRDSLKASRWSKQWTEARHSILQPLK